ncbi:MAG: prepilin-type N-terminal cleavage/methylation domain-containing protein [Planctomycetota bacterium]
MTHAPPPTPLSSLGLSRPRRGGFTLIELITSVSILALMLTLAARVFFDAQTAVERGNQTSQIIAEQRAISQPLFDDVRNMHVFERGLGGNTPGFLVIHQNAFAGVFFPPIDERTSDTRFWTRDASGDGNPNQADDVIRSDQIAFFRDAGGLRSLTPGGFDSYDSEARAQNARVWYGHVSPVPDNPANPSLDPGNTDYDLATQLVLGRQAMLLIENSSSTTYPNGDPGDDPRSANNREFGVSIGGTSASPENDTFSGEFDILDISAANLVYDDNGSDPSGGPLGLFRTPTFDEAAPGNQSVFGELADRFPKDDTPDDLPNAFYADFAAGWLYATTGQRLRASTRLDTDFTTGGIFTADEIARLHAAFSPHVADFAIEIACDWSDDLDLFTTPGVPTAGPDGMPDNEPDRDGAGNIRWYTLFRPNPDTDDDGIGNNFPDEPVTYDGSVNVSPFNGTAGAPAIPNPFVYTNAAGVGPAGSATFVFSHTGDNPATDASTNPPNGLIEGCGKYWPYLIRFRYRLMDGKGEFRSQNPVTGDPVVGRWFEQIVPVPRPAGIF